MSIGCIRRQLIIRSAPAGAEVLMNDRHVGTTPYAEDFGWYGWYRFALTKSGYERLDDHVQLRAPIYFWIPLDLVMELLPFPIRDIKTLSYTLTVKAKLPEPQPPVLEIPDVPQEPPSAAPAQPAQTTEETAHDAAR